MHTVVKSVAGDLLPAMVASLIEAEPLVGPRPPSSRSGRVVVFGITADQQHPVSLVFQKVSETPSKLRNTAISSWFPDRRGYVLARLIESRTTQVKGTRRRGGWMGKLLFVQMKCCLSSIKGLMLRSSRLTA